MRGRISHWLVEVPPFEVDLDDDDLALIEKIRESGTLECSSPVWRGGAIEDQDFSTLPFSVRLRRRKLDKETTARELQLARKQWEAEQRKLEYEKIERIKRWGLGGAEWENFDPNRHYEPEWKKDKRRRRAEAKGSIKKYRADKKLWHKVRLPERPKPTPTPPPLERPVYSVSRDDWWNWPELPPPPDQLFTSGNAVIVHSKDEKALLERYGVRLYFFDRHSGMTCYVTKSGRDFQREIG